MNKKILGLLPLLMMAEYEKSQMERMPTVTIIKVKKGQIGFGLDDGEWVEIEGYSRKAKHLKIIALGRTKNAILRKAKAINPNSDFSNIINRKWHK